MHTMKGNGFQSSKDVCIESLPGEPAGKAGTWSSLCSPLKTRTGSIELPFASAPPDTAFRASSFKRCRVGRLQKEMERAKESYKTLSLAVVLGQSLTG